MTLKQLIDPTFIGDALKQTPVVSEDSSIIRVQLKGASFELRYSVSFVPQSLRVECAIYARELDEAATWKPYYTNIEVSEFRPLWTMFIELVWHKQSSIKQAEKKAVCELVESYEYEREHMIAVV